jgi:hypothetical protein
MYKCYNPHKKPTTILNKAINYKCFSNDFAKFKGGISISALFILLIEPV